MSNNSKSSSSTASSSTASSYASKSTSNSNTSNNATSTSSSVMTSSPFGGHNGGNIAAMFAATNNSNNNNNCDGSNNGTIFQAWFAFDKQRREMIFNLKRGVDLLKGRFSYQRESGCVELLRYLVNEIRTPEDRELFFRIQREKDKKTYILGAIQKNVLILTSRKSKEIIKNNLLIANSSSNYAHHHHQQQIANKTPDLPSPPSSSRSTMAASSYINNNYNYNNNNNSKNNNAPLSPMSPKEELRTLQLIEGIFLLHGFQQPIRIDQLLMKYLLGVACSDERTVSIRIYAIDALIAVLESTPYNILLFWEHSGTDVMINILKDKQHPKPLRCRCVEFLGLLMKLVKIGQYTHPNLSINKFLSLNSPSNSTGGSGSGGGAQQQVPGTNSANNSSSTNSTNHQQQHKFNKSNSMLFIEKMQRFIGRQLTEELIDIINLDSSTINNSNNSGNEYNNHHVIEYNNNDDGEDYDFSDYDCSDDDDDESQNNTDDDDDDDATYESTITNNNNNNSLTGGMACSPSPSETSLLSSSFTASPSPSIQNNISNSPMASHNNGQRRGLGIGGGGGGGTPDPVSPASNCSFNLTNTGGNGITGTRSIIQARVLNYLERLDAKM